MTRVPQPIRLMNELNRDRDRDLTQIPLAKGTVFLKGDKPVSGRSLPFVFAASLDSEEPIRSLAHFEAPPPMTLERFVRLVRERERPATNTVEAPEVSQAPPR
ncbi:hypothetical protein HFO09_08865 [Rhizobium laguerreae]|uniref:hypothetical protein n=1 Tax=Rhizobium laguerreae TaxID=1076926 RepID=UPI001C90D066|nr:hypothetical protein [Rhizobium laguerreae]MBY3255797.1 hypothetical protein [Rhizobium laguerreae]MBY3282836.1 hypothetical protein [Rhizobium laguerreae]MBY3289190.1 hypothetical protein [Rhizobium laguerreae]